MTNYIQAGPPADPVIVRALCNHLLTAYDQFINDFDGTVDYLDGLMGVHNFHVRVIEHLVQETGDEIWRIAAAETFQRRMEYPGEEDTKSGLV